MALKSRTSFPPNGFTFYQAETGWTSPPHIGFGPTVDAIIEHRKSNPRFNLPTDRATVEMELDGYTEQRLRATYGEAANEWVVGGPPPTVFTRPLPPSLRAEGQRVAAGVVHKAVAGVGLLVSWLGDGLKPVEQGVANARAETCVKCPLNQKPTTLQTAYGTVANGLHLLMEAKADMKLSTPFDDRLETCAACDCRNALKIWTPIRHEKKYTTPAIMAALDPNCWVKRELENLST